MAPFRNLAQTTSLPPPSLPPSPPLPPTAPEPMTLHDPVHDLSPASVQDLLTEGCGPIRPAETGPNQEATRAE
jgi:hypothetical protein